MYHNKGVYASLDYAKKFATIVFNEHALPIYIDDYYTCKNDFLLKL